MRNIVVIGAGFAGLWSSISAARSLDELHENDVRITVINRDEWHGVRVRYYESELLDTRIPLNEILDPIGVELVVGEVEKIDYSSHARIYQVLMDGRSTWIHIMRLFASKTI